MQTAPITFLPITDVLESMRLLCFKFETGFLADVREGGRRNVNQLRAKGAEPLSVLDRGDQANNFGFLPSVH